jgi:hypothetical protein
LFTDQYIATDAFDGDIVRSEAAVMNYQLDIGGQDNRVIRTLRISVGTGNCNNIARLVDVQANPGIVRPQCGQRLQAGGLFIDPRLKFDTKHETYELARIELNSARDRLQLIQEGRISGRDEKMETMVRSPVAGILLERLVNPGDSVVPLTSYQEGTKLATIADMSDLIFKGTVDEIDVGKLQTGLPVHLKIGALPDKLVTGRLSRIAPQAIEKDRVSTSRVLTCCRKSQRMKTWRCRYCSAVTS